MHGLRLSRAGSGYLATPSADDTTPIEKERYEWARGSKSPFDQQRIDIKLTVVNGKVTSVSTVISESPSMSSTIGRSPQLHWLNLRTAYHVFSRAL
jgi:hypothetical protein